MLAAWVESGLRRRIFCLRVSEPSVSRFRDCHTSRKKVFSHVQSSTALTSLAGEKGDFYNLAAHLTYGIIPGWRIASCMLE